MYPCSFALNGAALSPFKIGSLQFDAYSGRPPHVNRRASACLVSIGLIPPGRYFIVDRQSGGCLEWFRSLFSDHSDWFALYADDARIDDETFCNQVKRGQFRLHAQGPHGISEGCITIVERRDFMHIHGLLKCTRPVPLKTTGIDSYGVVTVS
jgi:hypothetical protein